MFDRESINLHSKLLRSLISPALNFSVSQNVLRYKNGTEIWMQILLLLPTFLKESTNNKILWSSFIGSTTIGIKYWRELNATWCRCTRYSKYMSGFCERKWSIENDGIANCSKFLLNHFFCVAYLRKVQKCKKITTRITNSALFCACDRNMNQCLHVSVYFVQ